MAGDRVVAHLHFSGHFKSAFGQKQGTGQIVDFIATDILRVQAGRITDNWHITSHQGQLYPDAAIGNRSTIRCAPVMAHRFIPLVAWPFMRKFIRSITAVDVVDKPG